MRAEPFSQPQYDRHFFDYVNSGSVRSAQVVVPLLARFFAVRSVLDVGCASGAWLAAWRDHAVDDVIGLDGDYVDRSRLLVPTSCFQTCDLARPFDLKRRFDLVLSLEVAEHLPASCAAGFVASLVRHADVVLFSAAVPGQGGDHHVNEQPLEYWRALFARHRYRPVDLIRPKILGERNVERWYRYNLILYVLEDRLTELDEELRACAVPGNTPLADPSPWLYRCRRAVLRRLPTAATTAMAKWKERVVLSWRQGGWR